MTYFSSFAFKNTARVRPYVGFNMETQETEYGPEYEIACTWIGQAEQMREAGARGAEFISKNKIWTGDPRPKYLDMILINNAQAEWDQIRLVTSYDMRMFDKPDEYLLVT